MYRLLVRSHCPRRSQGWDSAPGAYHRPVAESAGEEWITVPATAKLLGVALHTAYDLIDRGEIRADVSIPRRRPKQRRLVRLQRRDVDDYIERARIKPGDLAHLHPQMPGKRYR